MIINIEFYYLKKYSYCTILIANILCSILKFYLSKFKFMIIMPKFLTNFIEIYFLPHILQHLLKFK